MYIWFSRYYTVLSLILSFFIDFEIVFFILFYLNIHLFLGIKAILKDYIHQKETKILLIFLCKVILIFTFVTLIEITF